MVLRSTGRLSLILFFLYILSPQAIGICFSSTSSSYMAVLVNSKRFSYFSYTGIGGNILWDFDGDSVREPVLFLWKQFDDIRGKIGIIDFPGSYWNKAFVNFTPHIAYAADDFLLLAGSTGPLDPMSGYETGVKVYVISRGLDIKHYVKYEIGRSSLSYARGIVRINSTHYLLPLVIYMDRKYYPTLFEINYSNDNLSIIKVFQINLSRYIHIYVTPIIYRDKIFWGPFILNKKYGLIKLLDITLDSFLKSAIIGNKYILLEYSMGGDNESTVLSIHAYNVSTLNLILNKTIFKIDAKVKNLHYIVDVALIGDNILFSIADTSFVNPFLDTNSIKLYTYSISRDKLKLVFESNGKMFYYGDNGRYYYMFIARANGTLVVIYDPYIDQYIVINTDKPLNKNILGNLALGDAILVKNGLKNWFIVAVGMKGFMVYSLEFRILPLNQFNLYPIIVLATILLAIATKAYNRGRRV